MLAIRCLIVVHVVVLLFAAANCPRAEVQIPVRPTGKDQPEGFMQPLSDEEERIIIDKGTERPFTGEYWNHFEPGVYVCRRCGARLYSSNDKFASDCGWPSFDDQVSDAVKREADPDGVRTEILCASCGAHLGHVFDGEGFTPKNIRHCVNSASLHFLPEKQTSRETAIFAGGCFWGVEHHFQELPGVVDVKSGYIGGNIVNPTYAQVCTGQTGHAEAVRVSFDSEQVSYEQLAKLFFEIHDPTQMNRQGPDVGTQYRSAVFYLNEQQKEIAEDLVKKLRDNGYEVVTAISKASEFYSAEDYHQDYLNKNPGRSSCHVRVPRFDKPKE